jgi:hypothetical protein
MASLRITRASGEVRVYAITPAVEWAFETQFKMGIAKCFREHERQSDIYWLSYECIRRSGETVPLFGDTFLDTLRSVEVVDDNDPKG